MSDEHERLVPTGAAARLFGVDGGTLQRWWRAGIVAPDLVTGGGRARWRLSSLRRQLVEHRQRSDDAGESAMTDEPQSLVATGVAATQVGVDRGTLVRWWHRGLVDPEHVTPGGHARWSMRSLLSQLQDAHPVQEVRSSDG